MLAFTLRELRARTRRLLGAGTAVVLGVAFLFATLTASDTLRSGFDRIFTDANAGVDLVVRDATAIGSEERRQRGTLDEALATRLRDTPGVATVVPADPPSAVRAHTRHGDIELVLPDTDDVYRIELDTGDGDTVNAVRSDPRAAPVIDLSTRHGDVTARYEP